MWLYKLYMYILDTLSIINWPVEFYEHMTLLFGMLTVAIVLLIRPPSVSEPLGPHKTTAVNDQLLRKTWKTTSKKHGFGGHTQLIPPKKTLPSGYLT